MASKHTKIPRAVEEFRLFLDYNYDSYNDAYRNIKPSQGWNIPYQSGEIYTLLDNLYGNLYEGIYPSLLEENPSPDQEIIDRFKATLKFFQDSTWVFDTIIEIKKKNNEDAYLGLAEGVVQELLYKAILKLKEVLQLAEEDIIRDKTGTVTFKKNENTICIVTATIEEYKTLLSKIPNASPLPTHSEDSQIYQRGTIDGKDNSKINVIFTMLHYQGIASACNTTTKMILSFKPKLVVMLGHAAGNKKLKKTISIGTILICNEAIDYDSAIVIDKGTPESPSIQIKDKPNPIKADETILQSLRNFGLIAENLLQIKNASRHSEKITDELNFKEGKLISGDALVRSADWFEKVTRDNHDSIGLDMETFGVYFAARSTLKDEKPLFISIKSVSDFGGSNNGLPEELKDTTVRVQYAIDTSINFFLDYMKNNFPL